MPNTKATILAKLDFLVQSVAFRSHLCLAWPFEREAGQGIIYLGRRDDSKWTMRVHVLAYQLFLGVLPPEHSVTQSCKKIWCFNPDHLELSTVSKYRPRYLGETRYDWMRRSVPNYPVDVCLEWPFARTADGYGLFYPWDIAYLAHVASYKLFVGPIADGLCVLHKCDNPPCINPPHLFLGTRPENNSDRHAKGRDGAAYGELSNTAKLTASQVREIREAASRGVPAGDLAKQYPVARGSIYAILRRKTWRHI